jgi:voltage-gated potassium channel Kch
MGQLDTTSFHQYLRRVVMGYLRKHRENQKRSTYRMRPRSVVIPYRRFGTTYGFIFRGQVVVFLDYFTLEDGMDRLYRNVGTELIPYAA